MNTQTLERTSCVRRVVVGTSVGVGTALAGVSTSFAAPPTADETAGIAMTTLGTRATTWAMTYALPAVIGVLGVGLIIGLVRKFGKRIVTSF